MRETFTSKPLETLYGYSSEDVSNTPFENVYDGYRTLAVSPGTGKIGVLFFPQYLPTNDLIYSRRTDDLGTNYVDESVEMSNETWSKTSRPPLVNFGGHRVGVVNQRMMFDATESQFDEDVLPTTYKWFINGTLVGGHSILYHSFDQPGLYTVSCRIQDTIGTRYVRILNEWGESDADVVSFGSLSGSVESGWQMSLEVKDTLTNNQLSPYQGVMLYVYDTLDQSWRRQYNGNMRAINRRMKSTSELPPDPLWQTTLIGWKEGEESYYVYTTEPQNASVLQQGCWPNVDFYLDTYLQSQSKYGAPANLGRALACELTGGNKTYPFGRARFTATGAEHVRQGMLALSEYYRDCGRSWKRAIKMFVDGYCDDNDDIEWNTSAGKVFDYWDLLDKAGGVGSSIVAKSSDRRQNLDRILSVPTPGHVLFFGYVDSCDVNQTANEVTLSLSIINSAGMLEKTFQRLESYWESGVHATSGGTVMDGPPMRSATCVHHLLTYHTNFAQYHDVILDWSGPRFWSTSSPEGTTWQAISGWAGNDYAWAFADRYGQLKYITRPQYKGSQWYAEAIKEAIRIDAEHVTEIQIQELRMLRRTAYTRLCGTVRGGNCEICGEFPCGGPAENSPGEWAIKRGLQYDDYRVLCRFAAYDFAYQNRTYDIQVMMPWRHDLDLGDLVFFPFRDPQNRFAWNVAAPPVFVIKGITHQYDVPSGRWITSIVAEQLTYGVACDCGNSTCPTTQDSGICSGDIGCDIIIDTELWKKENISVTSGTKIVPNVVTRQGAISVFNEEESQTATIYGEATSVSIQPVAESIKETVANTVTLMEPYMYLTTTSYKGNVGSALSQKVDMSVPFFTVGAKGPIGGTLKVEIQMRAKKKRRAYVHLFYTFTGDQVTSETDDYTEGQQVLVKVNNSPLLNGPSAATSTLIAQIPINTLLTITGSGVTGDDTKKYYPVVVDIGDFQNGDIAYTKYDNVKLRIAPGIAYSYNGTLALNTLVTINGEAVYVDDVLWYPINANSTIRWVTKDDLKYLIGWMDTVNIVGEQPSGQENPIADAQKLIPANLIQKLENFPVEETITTGTTGKGSSKGKDGNKKGKTTTKKNNFVRVATIEQYDYKLRDTKTSDYVDTLKINILLQTKDSNVNYKFGLILTSEYEGQSWAQADSIPSQEIQAWVNESSIQDQYGICDCSHLQITDLPQPIQDGLSNLGSLSLSEWSSLRNSLCQLYPPRKCLASSAVNQSTYEIILDDLETLQNYADQEIVYIQSTSEIIGGSASIEVIPACKDCYDPTTSGQNDAGVGYGPKPKIFLLAGHASYNDAGSSTERDLNIEMAKAYKEAFVEAGYEVKWWQEVDGDSNPIMSPGNHSTVAQGVANLIKDVEDRAVLLDLHHEMTPNAPGVFVIVPDGNTDDRWEDNADDVNVARILAENLKLATNLKLRTIGVREPGVMSEQQTGAAEQGGRLATFYYSRDYREKCVRLVIEHGNLLTTDTSEIYSAGYPARCASAAVKAINQAYPASSTAAGCPNWPTVENMTTELERVSNNGRKSPMATFGSLFLEWGSKYKINPGFVLALCFTESQYGTDGELSVYANNYGGHTYGNQNVSIATCGSYPINGVLWNRYCTPQEGAEALFKFLDKDIYRNSGGTIQDIIKIYSPVGGGVLGNSQAVIDEKYASIKIIGQKLGITLEKDTQIYTDMAACTTDNPTPSPSSDWGGYTTLFQWTFKQNAARITQGPYMPPTHSQCDCYDFGVSLDTAVYPIAEGTVTFAGRVDDAYRPNKVIIQTRFGPIIYAHLNSVNVKAGNKVYLNTLIGRSGTCCDNTSYGGEHLHLGLVGGIANSAGGKYTLTGILQAVGIDLSKFGKTY